MSDASPWRELHRTSDPRELVTIATSIAAMEFDVRCTDASGELASVSEVAKQQGPFVIQVRNEDFPLLVDALADIVAEQRDFDEMLERRGMMRDLTLKQLAITLAALAGIFILLWLSFSPR